ncbi:hypothetical protein ACMATS_14585 [Streptoverticillium reticulum]|uniref:hypothetical protein n=1 Tax=Streptoverticillium reticulum TaxID=1433415 RepID=UPI0039BF7338
MGRSSQHRPGIPTRTDIMRAFITALAVLTILLSAVGVARSRRRPEAPLPKGFFWALAAVNLTLAASVSWAQPG